MLLSLLQQLGCDLPREPVMKLTWIKDAAVALDPQVNWSFCMSLELHCLPAEADRLHAAHAVFHMPRCPSQDPVLRPHMMPILDALYSNMQAFAKSAAAVEVQPATLRLAMHVVNGTLAELRH